MAPVGKFFINGVPDSTSCTSSAIKDYEPRDLSLGYDKRDATSDPDYYDGEMDEIRIWSEARTQNEIREYMFKPLLGQEPNLEAYYPLDNPRHDHVHDMSLSNNHGTFYGRAAGALTLNSTSPMVKSTGAGTSLNLDGDEDWVRVDFDSALNPSTVTVEAWVLYDSAPSASEAIISSRSRWGGNSNGYVLLMKSDMTLQFTFGHSSGFQTLVTTDTVSTGSWQHIAATHQNGDTRIYINGLLVSSQDTSHSMVVNTGQPVRIGVTDDYSGGSHVAPDDRYFGGRMDDVRIWSGVRSQDEIFEYRNAILNGWEPDLIGYYKFDENNGTTIFDHSSKANHGSIQNGNQTNYNTSAPDLWNSHVAGEALGLVGSSETETATVADNDLLDITGDHAYTVWIKPTLAGLEIQIEIRYSQKPIQPMGLSS